VIDLIFWLLFVFLILIVLNIFKILIIIYFELQEYWANEKFNKKIAKDLVDLFSNRIK
jgi:hypothetical protein